MALKVLVVDDATFVRDLVKRTMRAQFPQVQVEEAVNGRKAQLLLSKQRFDLILCDWEMPEMSGLELLQWVRSTEHYKKVPFVMVTSRGDRGHVVEAAQQGVTDYLGKPFNAEMLVQKVTKAMGGQLKAKTSGSGGFGGDSAALLTGASAKAKGAAPAPSAPTATASTADLLTGKPAAGTSANPAARSAQSQGSGSKGAPPKGMAKVRFADFSLPCVIKAISLNEVQVVARRGQQFPMILDPAVIDIEVDEEEVLERINGYVHSLKAVDKRIDTDFVQIIIRFVDEDPDKMASLSKYIARFN